MPSTAARFFYNNIIDVSGVTMVASSAATPAATVLSGYPQAVWRATGDTDEYLEAQLPASVAATAMILHSHNLSSGATIGAYRDSGAGVTIDAAVTWYTGPIVKVFNSASSDYWRWRMQDAANADGYVEMGRMFVGTYFQVVTSWEAGWFEHFGDSSVVQESTNGVETGIVGTQKRRFSLSFRIHSEAERANWVTFWETVKTHTAFWIQVDPDNYPSSRTILCKFANSMGIGNLFVSNYEVSIDFVEAI